MFILSYFLWIFIYLLKKQDTIVFTNRNFVLAPVFTHVCLQWYSYRQLFSSKKQAVYPFLQCLQRHLFVFTGKYAISSLHTSSVECTEDLWTVISCLMPLNPPSKWIYRPVASHLQAFLSEWIKPQSEFPECVFLSRLPDTVKLFAKCNDVNSDWIRLSPSRLLTPVICIRPIYRCPFPLKSSAVHESSNSWKHSSVFWRKTALSMTSGPKVLALIKSSFRQRYLSRGMVWVCVCVCLYVWSSTYT